MSTRSLADKLQIKPNTSVWSSHPERLELIGPLPSGVEEAGRPEKATIALVFADDADSLRAMVDAYGGRLAEPSTLWVAYPKGNRADLNRDTLWPILSPHGLRPIGQVSVDEVWSAMRFRPLREGETFTGGR